MLHGNVKVSEYKKRKVYMRIHVEIYSTFSYALDNYFSIYTMYDKYK